MNRLFVMVFLTMASISLTYAQDKTIVLVRHAEKMASTEMDKTGDVDLSDEGRTRARHLLEIVKKYKPHEIFATSYKRVQQTVEPIAKYRNKEVQVYDPKDQAALVDKIMESRIEHYLIAGHSNTIPALANLLMKKEIFKQVPDNEYGVIWVVKIRKGVLKRVEVYTY